MASNTIIQCTSSSHAIKKYEYDVFVSFRGEDTRNNFTGFLFQALRAKRIIVFKDDQHLNKGESIAPELLQAIQGSCIFVVVFSKNYASSTWCLRELVEICNCIETSPRQLLPIFYDVDPSEVRKQSGYYDIAFTKHEENFGADKEKMEEVLRWRKTLSKVADFSGWHVGNKPQYVEIEEISETIKQKLGSKFSSIPKGNLVGMESRVEELARLLHLESANYVRFVGISGMGGIGKTTLARALYEQISHQYDAHCFIDDVSQTYRKYCGALGVQKQLLSQSLKEKNIEIANVSEGTQLAFSRLHAKGLIVFDNVDQVEQLNIFSACREITMLRECLGGGSRVIIVSRDEHILKTHGVDDVYKVEPLDRKDAIQLFCRKAFKGDCISIGYEGITHDILWHVQGHPLTIEVIGSSLFGKSISQWSSTLAKLRNNRSENIMDKLRIGFDELDSTNKEIFLDIACFFSSVHGEYVKEVLDFRGFYPEVGLQVLIDKSLITISHGDFEMHSMLRDLGKYIVRERSPNEPAKWSRLWDFEDVYKVMVDNMKETNIEAIVADDYVDDDMMEEETNETTITVNNLSKMRNLKLLMLPDNTKYSGRLNDLSNELGYLTWPKFPFECLPLCFEPHKLVNLILSGSNIKQLWECKKALPKLRLLDLSDSKNLIKMRNLGEAINLEILRLEGCTQLKKIDLPFGFPKNLTSLCLKECRSLINLPHFREALNLRRIDLEGCTKLRQMDSSIGLLRELYFLNLKDCKSLVSLPNSILELNSLEYLCLSGCSQLYSNQLLDEPRNAEHLEKLCKGEAPSHSQSTSSIVKRWFTRLSLLHSREQNESVNWLMPSLSIFSCMTVLDLSFCNLVQVPNAIGNLHSLVSLNLRGNNFAVMPSLKELSELIHLNLQHCKRLEYLPELPSETDWSSLDYNWQSLNYNWQLLTDDKVFGLNTFNCPELAKREGCSNICLPWMMQMIEAHISEFDDDWKLGGRRVSSIIPGSEIPRWWFKSEHVCTDNLMRIEHVMHENDWIGVACCAIFVARARNQRGMAPPKYGHHFTCSIPLLFRQEIVTVESDHLWLFYLTRLDFVGNRVPRGKKLVLKIAGPEGYDVEVKKYGYRPIHKKHVQLSNFALMRSETSLPQQRNFSTIQEIE